MELRAISSTYFFKNKFHQPFEHPWQNKKTNREAVGWCRHFDRSWLDEARAPVRSNSLTKNIKYGYRQKNSQVESALDARKTGLWRSIANNSATKTELISARQGGFYSQILAV